MDEETKNEFKRELRDLLEKYNVNISFDYDNGCYDNFSCNHRMIICQPIPNSYQEIEILSINGDSIDSNNI